MKPPEDDHSDTENFQKKKRIFKCNSHNIYPVLQKAENVIMDAHQANKQWCTNGTALPLCVFLL